MYLCLLYYVTGIGVKSKRNFSQALRYGILNDYSLVLIKADIEGGKSGPWIREYSR
jgi:hypothetical protein